MGEQKKRGNVWLAVAGLVKSDDGKWLVVKKKYGGLKGKWSLPAGFVEEGETADEAAIREVKEETGLMCHVIGLVGLRTGVIHDEISDNMLVFLLEKIEGTLEHQENELYEAKFIDPEELLNDKDASILLHLLIGKKSTLLRPEPGQINPGDQFGYTTYKIFI
ncbi:MAG: NUDIX hydrolase [Bacillota bacterium]|nr:NUDIX hydrolase [Bacillota bacterium]MDP4170390.1 NUDIX hydrolase [Bacillota bacterium]